MTRNANRALLALGVTALAVLGLGGSCNNKPPPVEAGLDAAIPPDATAMPPDAEVVIVPADAGTPDTGPVLVPCSYDEDCGPLERCSETFTCMPAVTCDTPDNCLDDNDPAKAYCDNTGTGLGCRCVKAPGAKDGACKRRLPPCAPCTTDEQCGTDPLFFRTPFHEPGKCLELDGVKVCLETYSAPKCGCGLAFTIDSKLYCTPQGTTASCKDGEFLCCKTDANCPPEHPLCDTVRGRCQDLCWYDYDKDQTVGCRADKVCNVDPQFLDPVSANFAAGRCGPACAVDTDCTSLRGDFVCRPEKKSEPRCRPPGCISDVECPNPVMDETNPHFPYAGYCERGGKNAGVCICGTATSTCDCRTGKDPMTTLPYRDCKEGFKCEEPAPGTPGVCLEKNCIEQGGTVNFCPYDHFCCGEDRDKDGKPDPCTDFTGQVVGSYGKCYPSPKPPWCLTCEKHSDCAVAGTPASQKDFALCIDFGPDKNDAERGTRCMYACETAGNCPKGYACTEFPVDCSKDAAQCGDAARCYDTGLKDQDNQPIKYCKCNNAGQRGGECPVMDPNDPAGVVSRCSDAIPGGQLHCIWTRGCYPKPVVCVQ